MRRPMRARNSPREVCVEGSSHGADPTENTSAALLRLRVRIPSAAGRHPGLSSSNRIRM